MNKTKRLNLDKNDLALNEFFSKTRTMIHSKFDQFDYNLKRIQFKSNMRLCSRSYRSQKLKRLKELITNPNDEHKSLTESTDLVEEYFTPESSLPSDQQIEEDYTSFIVPDIKVNDIKKTNESESEVTLFWSLLDKKENKICNDNTEYLNTIQEYEIYSSCVESLEEEENLLKITDKTKIDQLNIWDKIGTVKAYNPPIRCLLKNCANGTIYYFVVRIKYKNNVYSEFSDFRRVQF